MHSSFDRIVREFNTNQAIRKAEKESKSIRKAEERQRKAVGLERKKRESREAWEASAPERAQRQKKLVGAAKNIAGGAVKNAVTGGLYGTVKTVQKIGKYIHDPTMRIGRQLAMDAVGIEDVEAIAPLPDNDSDSD